MSFTDEQLTNLKELLGKVTRGEWSWEGYEDPEAPPPTLYAGRSVSSHGYNLFGRLRPDPNGKHNLDAICALVNYVPALLARLDAAEALVESAEHERDCILSYFEAGEPTTDGGYRSMFKGKWYQTKPIDESPKCDCGLAEVYDAWLKSKGKA